MLTSIRRRVSVFACAIATAAIGVEFTLFGQSAFAQVAELTCIGTQTNNYSPGLTLFDQQTTITGEGSLTSCVVPSDSTFDSGNYQIANQAVQSCALSSPAQPFTSRINWSNGKSSTVRYTSVTSVKVVGNNVVTATGSVLSGEFQGAMVTRINTLATPNFIECATPEGVTTVTGPVTLTFTRL